MSFNDSFSLERCCDFAASPFYSIQFIQYLCSLPLVQCSAFAKSIPSFIVFVNGGRIQVVRIILNSLLQGQISVKCSSTVNAQNQKMGVTTLQAHDNNDYVIFLSNQLARKR